MIHLPHDHGQGVERVLERMPAPEQFQIGRAHV